MSASPLTLTVDNDAPMRLAHAVKIAFPHGGMTVAGLRKEAARGRLVIERIAGKDFTTIAAIADMRSACRLEAKVPDSTCDPATKSARPHGSSSTPAGESALASLRANVKMLKGGSRPTSPISTARAASAA
jgi:hypothetical protein